MHLNYREANKWELDSAKALRAPLPLSPCTHSFTHCLQLWFSKTKNTIVHLSADSSSKTNMHMHVHTDSKEIFLSTSRCAAGLKETDWRADWELSGGPRSGDRQGSHCLPLEVIQTHMVARTHTHWRRKCV